MLEAPPKLRKMTLASAVVEIEHRLEDAESS